MDIFNTIKTAVSCEQVYRDSGYEANSAGFYPAVWRGDHNPNVKLNNDGTWHDFATGDHGDVIKLFMLLEGIDQPIDAAHQLAQRYNITLEEQRNHILTVNELADYKKIPASFLEKLGVRNSKKGVIISYHTLTGKPAKRYQIRYALSGDKKQTWDGENKGTAIMLYGLWLIPNAQTDYQILVEGPTDCWSMWFHRRPAIGFPGAATTNKLELKHVEKFKKVYIWIEPDQGGETFREGALKQLKTIGYAGEVFLINGGPGIKDASELHMNCKDDDDAEFQRRLDEILNQGQKVDFSAVTIEKSITKTKKTESAWPYDQSEIGLADFFANENENLVRYCHQLGKWLVFDGKRLLKDEDGQVIEIAKETIRKLFAIAANIKDDEERESIIGFALGSSRKHVIKAMLELAQSDPRLVVNFKDLDANDFEINTPNGVVDLITQTIRPAKITDLNTKLTGAPWIPGKRDPKWDNFLIDALPNESTRGSYKRSMGYCISGSNEEERIFMNIGPPGSGKGTAQASIKATLGDYAGTVPPRTFLIRESGGIGNDVAGLLDYRVVFASEINEGERLNEALVNTLSGRDQISVRFLFREFFQATVKFKIWLSANSPPRIQGDKINSGIWRRLVRFGFKHPVSEEKKDPGLKTYFETSPDARAAVLNWLVEGFAEWRKNGLGISDEVKQDTKAYADDQDPLKPFFEDCCMINPLARVTPNAIYKEYVDWCHENGNRYIMNQRTFSQRLFNCGFEQGKSDRTRFWKGIGILTKKDSTNDTTEELPAHIGKVIDLPLGKAVNDDEALY